MFWFVPQWGEEARALHDLTHTPPSTLRVFAGVIEDDEEDVVPLAEDGLRGTSGLYSSSANSLHSALKGGALKDWKVGCILVLRSSHNV